MARWVKFSDRLPTEADADPAGFVTIQHESGIRSIVTIHWASENPCHREECCWLENVPEIPKPRTLEDVVKSLRLHFMHGGSWGSKRCGEIKEEMREILERAYNE